MRREETTKCHSSWSLFWQKRKILCSSDMCFSLFPPPYQKVHSSTLFSTVFSSSYLPHRSSRAVLSSSQAHLTLNWVCLHCNDARESSHSTTLALSQHVWQRKKRVYSFEFYGITYKTTRQSTERERQQQRRKKMNTKSALTTSLPAASPYYSLIQAKMRNKEKQRNRY